MNDEQHLARVLARVEAERERLEREVRALRDDLYDLRNQPRLASMSDAQELIRAVRGKNNIQTVKMFQHVTGCGLKEAGDAVNALEPQEPTLADILAKELSA